MTEQAASANGSVFISYSRKDKAFVKKLNDSLDKADVHAWVDWEGIELASATPTRSPASLFPQKGRT
ncbi:MAG TPA: toll/interleukin-1 receptor domain-containing protein [Anaerolineales bacterium]|nr:toll/interleukin-1 receptor domain-containing protein [Anaerolineales bacterium]